MDSLYAEIIIDKKHWPKDKALHYAIPPSLKRKIEIGKRVLIPLLRQTVIGYVVGFADKPEVEKVKNILEVLDQEPLFDQSLLSLAYWMKEYYLCTLGEALNCLVPTGTKATIVKRVRITEEAKEEVKEAINKLRMKNPNQADLLALLLAKNEINWSTLVEKIGEKNPSSLIKKWQNRGYLEVESFLLPPIVKIKEKRVWGIDIASSVLEENLKELRERFPKQAQILEIIAQNNYLLSSSEITSLAGTSSAPLKSLQQKGLLEEKTLEVNRDPLGQAPFPDLPLNLNLEQKEALETIKEELEKGKGQTILLHGITGSGKTEVYLQIIAHSLSKGKQAIVLVPEISLTPQTLERFRKRFGYQIAVLHSHLSLGERYDQWRKIKSGKINIVIGARSALFAPLPNLGIIIIDEEHENSYKQEENPRYHARELAQKRIELVGGVLVLGTATPTIESYYRVGLGKYKYVSLPSRIDNRPLPDVEIVDMRLELQQGNRSVFSQSLTKGIEDRLSKGEQTILFLNRRGFSTFVLCRECGLVLRCPDCDVSLTYHNKENILKCHYCHYQKGVPDLCPRCSSRYIRYFGTGTQKVELELTKLFPKARILRMDMDTTRRKDAHKQMLKKFAEKEIDILLGTQMIAKGLDFPQVTLVGVITADTLLNFPDFRAGERTFQLLTQVAGRAGRGEIPGKVIVQTYCPEHYSIRSAQKQDFLAFYEQEIEYRRQLGYPPFNYLVNIIIKGEDEKLIITKAEKIAFNLKSFQGDTEILGPIPAPLSKIKGNYRWQLILKNKNLEVLRKFIRRWQDTSDYGYLTNQVGIIIDIEPLGML